MITKDPGLNFDTYYGLSTDIKPITDRTKNGSVFYEMNTGKMYMFDKQNKTWILQ